ncbi:MAG TPA: putative Ig domain-containing protein [Gaiellaceae bacterium]|nr:putative Ig domain-containing protein [Gaiellaceae bacterium]
MTKRVLVRCGVVLLVALAIVVGVVGTQPQTALADLDVCGLNVYDSLVHFSGIYLGPDPQLCGVEELENDAYVMYAGSHGLPLGDPRITQAGQYEIAGILWALLLQIADAHKNNPSSLTANENGAYDWLRGKVNNAREDAAHKAQDEYNRWQQAPCTYQTPDPQLFTFDAPSDPACSGGLSALFAGPSPPSFTELVEMGEYDANKDLYTSGSFGGSTYQKIATERILESQATWSAGLLGAIGPVLQNLAPDVFSKYVGMVRPFEKQRVQRANIRARAKIQKASRQTDALEEEDTLEAENEAPDVALEEDASLAGEDLTDAGIEASGEAAASLGAESLSGPFFIVGIAAAVLIQETIKVVEEAKIPQQLQANIDSADAQELADLVENGDGGGYASVFEDFAAQLRLPAPSIGTSGHVTSSPPNDGSVFEEEFADDSGTTRYTEFNPTVQLLTWPLGIDQGSLGAPSENFDYYSGQIWHQIGSESDDHLAGLSGWVPSGELHYYDWSGHPRVALVDGSQFLDFPSPGSIDVSGYDASLDGCTETLACQQTNVIFALVGAGGVTPSYTTDVYTNGGFTEERTYYPSDGSLKPPYFKVRLVLKPDTGAPAVINVNNQFGWTANSAANTYPNGGLHVGDTVTLTDPLDHPYGAATTYTWKIESRCAYGDTCTPDSDSAFHGHPTVTLTGKSVDYTWPAPGTYHILLTTLDQYGHSRTSTQEQTVVGTAPSLTGITSNIGSAGLAVYGPVQNGDPVTFTGCVKTSAGRYADPHVSFDWGDGTVDTATAESGTSALSIHYGATGGCDQLWQFTATHTYDLSSNVYQVQKPLHYTIADGLDPNDTITLSPYINVTFAAPPTFTSPSTTTFTAGVTGYFAFSANGQPAPTLSYVSGAFPSGVGIATDSHGVLNIDGDANVNDAGGTYPITVRATNSEGHVDQTFDLVLNVPPKITSSSSALIPVDVAKTIDVTATGYPQPDVTITGSIPGMTIVDGAHANGSITGTPTQQGVYTLTVQASSDAGVVAQTLKVQVGSAPAFLSASSASFVTTNASSFNVSVSGAPTPSIGITSGTLPAGLSFADEGNGTAEIYGQPSGSGTTRVTLTATNAAGSATQDLTITTSPTGGPNVTVSGSSVTTQLLDPGSGLLLYTAVLQSGTASSVTFTSSDDTAALTTSSQLPSGLTFHDNGDGTATLSGTPADSAGGYWAVEVTATPSGGPPVGLAYLDLEIFSPPVLTNDPTATFVVGQSGSFDITAAGIFVARYSLALASNPLPDGLTFDDSGGTGTATISGTPTAGTAGIHTVTIESVSLPYLLSPIDTTQTIEVDQTPAITSDDTTSFGEGVAGSFDVTTTGFPAPALTVIGDLPPGVTFTDHGDGTGTFSGTPTDTAELSYPVTVAASNVVDTATQSLTLNVGPLPQFLGDTSATFLAGDSSASLDVASFTDPDVSPVPTLSATGLPSGVSLTDNGDGTGTIGGTPDVGSGGAYTVHVTATNAYGSTSEDLTLVVNEAPSYAGMDFGSCTSPNPSQTTVTFIVDGGHGVATPCASGYPAPTMSVSGILPEGMTFTDDGDGSATITGDPVSGTGGDYDLTLTLSNAAGTVTQPLTLEIDEQAHLSNGDFEDEVQWVSGQENTYTATITAFPYDTIFLGSILPSWLSYEVDNDHPGTIILSGDPPLDELGQETDVSFTMPQGFGNGIPMTIAIQVEPFTFTDDAPPDPHLDAPYSYQFATTADDTTFAVADGDSVPDGMTLSSDGLLAGTPSSVNRWNFSVVATDEDGSVSTEPIEMSVQGREHSLEISSFRLYGPDGRGDWFVTARNVTSSIIPLYGWKVGVFMPGQSTPLLETLPPGSLAPNQEVTLSGPTFSLAPFATNDVIGPSIVANPGGFELVASDGTVSDKAGVAGAPAAAYSGTALPVPTGSAAVAQSAFVRRSSDATLVDTDDNASDFAYQSQRRSQTVSFLSSPPAHAVVGGMYDLEATGSADSGIPVTYSNGDGSTPGTCLVDGSHVSFLAPGICVVEADQAGDVRYSAAAARQSITVTAAPSTKSVGSGGTGTPGSGTGGSTGSTSTATSGLTPDSSTSLIVSSGSHAVSIEVPKGAVSTEAQVTATIAPTSTGGVTFSVGSVAVQLSVTGGGSAITHFDQPLDLTFAVPDGGFKPAYTTDGVHWFDIPEITSPPTLPATWPDGWYETSTGFVHLLTRHATTFALLTPASKTVAALRFLHFKAAGSVNLRARHTVALTVRSTLPAKMVVTLRRGKKKVATWTRALGVEQKTFALLLPKAARKAGSDTLLVHLAVGHEALQRTARVKLVLPRRK